MAARLLFAATMSLGLADAAWLDLVLAPELVARAPTPPVVAARPMQLAAAVPAPPVVPPIEAPAPAVSAPVIERLYFESRSDRLDSAARATLARLTNLGDAAQIVVVGFTDAHGDELHNRALRQRRALAVRRVLLARGAPADRIELRDPGPAPLAADAELWRDRRVELHIHGGDR